MNRSAGSGGNKLNPAGLLLYHKNTIAGGRIYEENNLIFLCQGRHARIHAECGDWWSGKIYSCENDFLDLMCEYPV